MTLWETDESELWGMERCECGRCRRRRGDPSAGLVDGNGQGEGEWDDGVYFEE